MLAIDFNEFYAKINGKKFNLLSNRSFIMSKISFHTDADNDDQDQEFFIQQIPELRSITASINVEYLKINFNELLRFIFSDKHLLLKLRSISLFWSYQRSTSASLITKFPSFFLLFNDNNYDFISYAVIGSDDKHKLKIELDDTNYDGFYKTNNWQSSSSIQLYLFRSNYFISKFVCLNCNHGKQSMVVNDLTFPRIPLQLLFDCPTNPCLSPLIDAIYYHKRLKSYLIFQGRWLLLYRKHENEQGFDLTALNDQNRFKYLADLSFHVRMVIPLKSSNDNELLLIGYNTSIPNNLQLSLINIKNGSFSSISALKNQSKEVLLMKSIEFRDETSNSTKFDLISGLLTIKDQRYNLWLIVNHNDEIMLKIYVSSLMNATNLKFHLKKTEKFLQIPYINGLFLIDNKLHLLIGYFMFIFDLKPNQDWLTNVLRSTRRCRRLLFRQYFYCSSTYYDQGSIDLNEIDKNTAKLYRSLLNEPSLTNDFDRYIFRQCSPVDQWLLNQTLSQINFDPTFPNQNYWLPYEFFEVIHLKWLIMIAIAVVIIIIIIIVIYCKYCSHKLSNPDDRKFALPPLPEQAMDPSIWRDMLQNEQYSPTRRQFRLQSNVYRSIFKYFTRSKIKRKSDYDRPSSRIGSPSSSYSPRHHRRPSSRYRTSSRSPSPTTMSRASNVSRSPSSLRKPYVNQRLMTGILPIQWSTTTTNKGPLGR